MTGRLRIPCRTSGKAGLGRLCPAAQQRPAAAHRHRLALPQKPAIIFLDEPTASFDAIKQGRTVVILSHSLAQIVDSDYIYVMKKGHLVESGTHDELYDLKGTYRSIFDASERSLNIEKLAKTMADDGDDVLDTAS